MITRQEYLKKYHSDNKEKINQKHRENYVLNRESIIKRTTEYHKLHPEQNKKATKKYRETHRQEMREMHIKWRIKNPDKYKKSINNWRANNPNYGKEWAKNNREILNHRDSLRRALELNAMPEWANKEDIKKIYIECVRIIKKTGIKHEVDHIYPLKSKILCGLHVPCNLQIITSEENRRKSNRICRPLQHFH